MKQPPQPPLFRVARADHVDRDAMEPGAKGAVAAERAQAPPRTDEDLLREVLGIATSARQHARQGDHRRLVPADELVERIAIAAGRRFYQRAVGIHCLIRPAWLPVYSLGVRGAGEACARVGSFGETGWSKQVRRAHV